MHGITVIHISITVFSGFSNSLMLVKYFRLPISVS